MITIEINGQSAFVRNLSSLGFVVNFREDFTELEMNTDTLVCVNETRKQILAWKDTYGCHVGIPTTIKYGTLSFDYFINLSQGLKVNEKECFVKIQKRKGKDSFEKSANGTSFELMVSEGVQFPIFQMPYVIITKNRLETGITLSLALFSMTQAFIQAIKDTAVVVEDLTATALAFTSPSLLIGAIAKAVAQVVYDIALATAILRLANDLKELIFPKLRYMNVCKVKDLLSYGCNYLGYSFQSTLLDQISGLTFIPVPLQKKKKSIFDFLEKDLVQSFSKGYPTASDTTGTLGSLFEALKIAFNGKIKVNNGVVEFERRDYWKNLSAQQITPFLNLQDSRQNEYTLNTQVAWIRYYLTWQTDQSETFTLDNFEPADSEYGAKNTNQLDPDLNLIQGLQSKQIPFSLATPKDHYNWLENLALELFSSIDAIIKTNLAGSITDRKGAMQVSEQFYSMSKLAIISNGKIQLNQYDFLSAPNLYNKYHSIEEIANNSFAEFELAPIECNQAIFEGILNNNFIQVNNENCEILEVEFVPESSKAIISYRKKDNWAIGKITTFAVNT